MEKFSIHIPHFYCLEYCEGNKKMDIEMDFRERVYILDRGLIKNWKSPYQNEVITEEKKLEIIRNVREFLLQRTTAENIEYSED